MKKMPYRENQLHWTFLKGSLLSGHRGGYFLCGEYPGN